MLAVKKINNNVAVCMDSNGKKLVAFGKGIGFRAMPYEITDLSILSRTFYDISPQYIAMLNDIPSDVIEFTARIIDIAQKKLTYDLNPNLILTLADHIAFAMERQKKSIYVQMPLAYDIGQIYPDEIQIAKYTIKKIKESFNIQLPSQEESGIALSLVNAKLIKKAKSKPTASYKEEQLLDELTKIIENQMHIQVSRKSFNYARFATHVIYLLHRICEHKYVSSENSSIYHSLKNDYKEVSECVDKMDKYLNEKFDGSISEEEKLYLILHVNRICTEKNQ